LIFPDYPFEIILSSGSPRRKVLLKQSRIDFISYPIEFEETYPSSTSNEDIAKYIAHQKGLQALDKITPSSEQVIITADCLVFHKGQPLGKPNDINEAKEMLRIMSGQEHSVISGICFINKDFCLLDSCTTKVTLIELSPEIIEYYVQEFNPLDKAGSYGIQEWFGHTCIKKINGSYTNVMGLPMHLVFKYLESIAQDYF
jgi:septum formation protein